MFTKRRTGYHYDADPIRIPLVRPMLIPARKRPFINIGEPPRTERVWNNPMGRNSGSVWTIEPANHYFGGHTATMPEELVRKCLRVSCPENGLVLDCFSGAGTTALVATDLGHRAISIDINPAYTKEARQRLAAVD